MLRVVILIQVLWCIRITIRSIFIYFFASRRIHWTMTHGQNNPDICMVLISFPIYIVVWPIWLDKGYKTGLWFWLFVHKHVVLCASGLSGLFLPPRIKPRQETVLVVRPSAWGVV